MADVFQLVAAVTQLKSRVQALIAENAKLIEELKTGRNVPQQLTRGTKTLESRPLEPREEPQSAADSRFTSAQFLAPVIEAATEEVLGDAARKIFLRSLRHQS